MAVIHKGVDKIIDSSNNEVVISTASTTIDAVNDASTGLSSKAQASDVTNGLATKLDKTAQAADSAKLGNMAPSHYAAASDLANCAQTGVANTFTVGQTVTVNSNSPALKVTQEGAGNAIEIHDAPSDTTYFHVDQWGSVVTGNSVFVKPISPNTDAALEVGHGRTADGNSYIDLIGDATNTDFATRLMRYAGENAASQLSHRGTGPFSLSTLDGAEINVDVGSTTKIQVNNSATEVFNNLNVHGSANVGGQAIATKEGLAATTDGSTALGWDGSKFKVVPAGGSTDSISDIGDVSTSGLQAGMVLMWNGSQWEPGVVASGPRTVTDATKTNGVLAGGAYCWFSGGWNDRSDVYGQNFASSGTYGVMSGSQEGRGHCSDGTNAYFAGGTGYGTAVGKSLFASAGITQGWSNLSSHTTANWGNGTSNGTHSFWTQAAHYNDDAYPVKTAHADGAVAHHNVSLLASTMTHNTGGWTGTSKYAGHAVGNGVHLTTGDNWIVKMSMWDTNAATFTSHGAPNPGGGSDQSTNGELIIGFHGRDTGSSGRHNRTMTTSFTDVNAQWTSQGTYGSSTNGSACGTNGQYLVNHGGDLGSHRTSQGQRTSWADLSSNAGWGGSGRHGHHGNLVPNG